MRNKKKKMAAETGRRKRGRPPGSKTQTLPQVETAATACPSCKSTERGPYFNTRGVNVAGVHPTLGIYSHVTWRRTQCLTCGQYRDDKEYSHPNGQA